MQISCKYCIRTENDMKYNPRLHFTRHDGARSDLVTTCGQPAMVALKYQKNVLAVVSMPSAGTRR